MWTGTGAAVGRIPTQQSGQHVPTPWNSGTESSMKGATRQPQLDQLTSKPGPLRSMVYPGLTPVTSDAVLTRHTPWCEKDSSWGFGVSVDSIFIKDGLAQCLSAPVHYESGEVVGHENGF